MAWKYLHQNFDEGNMFCYWFFRRIFNLIFVFWGKGERTMVKFMDWGLILSSWGFAKISFSGRYFPWSTSSMSLRKTLICFFPIVLCFNMFLVESFEWKYCLGNNVTRIWGRFTCWDSNNKNIYIIASIYGLHFIYIFTP